MKIAVWNCRGLGQADSPKIPYVSSLVRSHSIDLMCLMETMLPVDIVVQKLAPLSYLGCNGIDAVGLSGGMFILDLANRSFGSGSGRVNSGRVKFGSTNVRVGFGSSRVDSGFGSNSGQHFGSSSGQVKFGSG